MWCEKQSRIHRERARRESLNTWRMMETELQEFHNNQIDPEYVYKNW